MTPLILVGISIRSAFDNGEYIQMGIAVTMALIILLVAEKLYKNSRKRDGDNGGIVLEVEQ